MDGHNGVRSLLANQTPGRKQIFNHGWQYSGRVRNSIRDISQDLYIRTIELGICTDVIVEQDKI